MRIGDEIYIHGYVDEIRKDTVIIRNDGGYFGTVKEEIVSGELRMKQDVDEVVDRVLDIICDHIAFARDCNGDVMDQLMALRKDVEQMKGAGLSEQQSDDVIYAIRRESFNNGKDVGWDYAVWKSAEVVRDRMLATDNENVYTELLSCYREISGMFMRYEEFANGDPKTETPRRQFVELIVEYPPEDTCTYPEYLGKPYFSIKFIEDGECLIGFGTYNPEVLSRYIKEYFIKMETCQQKDV